jgi:VanZ family protein
MGFDRLSAPLKLLLYGTAVAILLWLCLAPSRDLPQLEVWDKAEHATAWAVLTGLGLALFPRASELIAGFALGLGGLVEILQWTLPFGRDADWRDLAADGLGVAIVMAVFVVARRASQRP